MVISDKNNRLLNITMKYIIDSSRFAVTLVYPLPFIFFSSKNMTESFVIVDILHKLN